MQGEHQRRLYKELLANYNRLERPVVNDSAPILVELGLTLLQIIDVVSVTWWLCGEKKMIYTYVCMHEYIYMYL